jgi:hypothetical protein
MRIKIWFNIILLFVTSKTSVFAQTSYSDSLLQVLKKIQR